MERLKFDGFVFAFDNIGAVISFCGHLAGPIKVQSRLFKDVEKNKFFLHFQRGRESMIHFAALFTMAYEFGEFATTSPVTIAHMEESMECLIAERAVNRLRKISGTVQTV